MKSPLQRRVEQAIVSRVARFTSWWARTLPLRAVWAIADFCGMVIVRLFPSRQRLADRNIAAAFPSLTARERYCIRRDCVRNICRTMAELFRLPAISPAQLKAMVHPADLSPLRDALESGHGVLIVSAHYGNWEWLGALLNAELVPFTVIARDAAHDVTASLINAARESHGLQVIGRRDTRRMLKVLSGGGMLGIVPDQHALQGGQLLEFLGRPAWTFTGPAQLASRTGAKVFPCFMVRDFRGGRFTLEIHPEVEMVDSGDRVADLTENTRRITAAIETAIRTHPEQWLWLHDRWRAENPAEDAE